jgi:hypothetical protein
VFQFAVAVVVVVALLFAVVFVELLSIVESVERW